MNRLAIAAAMLIVWSAALGYLGFQAGRASGADRASTLLSRQMDAVLAEQAEDRKRAIAMQKKLDKLPRSQGKVNEAVAQHPSGCVLDPVVVGVLQDAIRKANASRALPADP
jgi:hypothetical protein